MRIKSVKGNNYIEIERCGREGISIRIGDSSACSSIVVDEKDFNDLLEDMNP